MGLKLPMPLAVTLWAASSLAVLTYTALAFKETANGLESGAIALETVADPLVEGAAFIAATEMGAPKKQHRGKFKHSPAH
jgi:hypothetical protein